jgi:hypothetical protein
MITKTLFLMREIRRIGTRSPQGKRNLPEKLSRIRFNADEYEAKGAFVTRENHRTTTVWPARGWRDPERPNRPYPAGRARVPVRQSC